MAAVIKVVIGCFLEVHTFSCLIFRCTWQQQRCRHCCWSHSWHTRASRLWCSHILLQKVSTISCSAHICCGQMAAWIKMPLRMEVGLSPGDCVRRGPSPLPQKGRSSLPNFRLISIVAKRLDASRCHLVWMLASAQGTLC